MDKITGKVFMFTGTLKVPRHEAQRTVSELGGIVGSTVNKDTDFLVVGEDQAGKSNKFVTAGLLGVTRVDEDYFWEMVEEAKKEVEDYSGLKGWMTEQTFFNVLMILEERVKRREERVYPPLESMTYYSQENLDKWKGQPPKLGKRVCPHCSKEIPYSINERDWYCFKCKLYCDVGQETGRHACVDYERFMEVETGFYESCKVCGNVKFVAFDEAGESVKIDERCNYSHSLEFEAEVIQEYAGIGEKVNVSDKLGEHEREVLWERFARSEKRRLEKIAKKEALKQAQFEIARNSQ